VTPDDDQAPRFETEIKPMFREHDRESMQAAPDLFQRWAEGGKPP